MQCGDEIVFKPLRCFNQIWNSMKTIKTPSEIAIITCESENECHLEFISYVNRHNAQVTSTENSKELDEWNLHACVRHQRIKLRSFVVIDFTSYFGSKKFRSFKYLFVLIHSSVVGLTLKCIKRRLFWGENRRIEFKRTIVVAWHVVFVVLKRGDHFPHNRKNNNNSNVFACHELYSLSFPQ